MVIKSCISCSSLASEIILSVLSVKSDMPVKLNCEKWDPVCGVYGVRTCFLCFFLLLAPPLPPGPCCAKHGNCNTPPFCMHLVWNNCLQSAKVHSIISIKTKQCQFLCHVKRHWVKSIKTQILWLKYLKQYFRRYL